MTDEYSQTELTRFFFDKMHLLGVDEEFPLVKMKNVSQKYTYFEDNFISPERNV